MIDDHKKQSQFELFPNNHSPISEEESKSVALLKDLTLSQENIIVLCIVLLMVCIVFFSYGVERGKRVAQANGSPVIEQKEVQESVIVIADPVVQEAEVVIQEVEIVPEELITVQEEVLDIPSESNEVLENFYTVQIASFKLESNAHKEAAKAAKVAGNKHESFVVPKGKHSIVCVGKFIQRERAKAFSKKIKKKYGDCLVRRL